MSPVFVCGYHATPEHLKEATLATVTLAAKLYFSIFAVLFLGIGVFWLLAVPERPSTGIIFIVGAILFLGLFILRIRQGTRLQYRRQLMLAGGQIPATTIRFFEDRIETDTAPTNTHRAFAYGDTVRLQETQHLYLLIIKNKMMLPIEKDSFALGDSRQLAAFLQQKNPSIKIK